MLKFSFMVGNLYTYLLLKGEFFYLFLYFSKHKIHNRFYLVHDETEKELSLVYFMSMNPSVIQLNL